MREDLSVAEPAAASVKGSWGISASTTQGLLAKIALLAVVTAIAVWLAIPLYAAQLWVPLAVVVLTTLAIYFVYLQPWHIPLKYLVPGTIFLLAFQVIPVVATVATAFTNFGDGHRGTKAEAITAIQSSNVQRVPGSIDYTLTIATTGDAATGDLIFLLYDPVTKTVQRGDDKGLTPVTDATVIESGKVTAAPGLTILNTGQAAARSAELEKFFVPTANGAIKSQGLGKAYEGKSITAYDAGCDCITDASSGLVYTADNTKGLFIDPGGNALSQGWQVGVGLGNVVRAFTDPAVSGPFIGILIWNFAFAFLSVGVTFIVGLAVAMALNSPDLKALRFYRILIVLPYAMPAFAMLLVWRDMFNQDFGLINSLTGANVNWFGGVWTARFAILLTQFWLGYPYMFLVCLGALQSIPKDLTEAAAIDGAQRWQAFRAVVLPLLLVAVAPLLISSFAFNFNNFNVIQLTTAGGPFPPESPQAGATDLLVSYTYRLAFGAGGVQYGFAAAISILIFLIVAGISIIGFRRTAALEEINR
jgi:arabinogalactan oligomer/maltooligosaccharide transport system permease protein